MSDLPGLHTQARRLVMTLRGGLERLEEAEVSDAGFKSDGNPAEASCSASMNPCDA